MKIKGKELGIIIILFGVLIVFATYSFYFRGNREKTAQVVEEENSLQTEVDRLNKLKDNEESINRNIRKTQKSLNALMERFPSKVLYEDGVMFLKDVEEHNEVKIPTYTITESTPAIASVQELEQSIRNQNQQNENVQDVGSGYTMTTGNVKFSYTTNYDELKKMIRYIYGYGSKRKAIDSIEIAKDKDGKLTGSVSVNMFALTDGNRTYDPEKISGVNSGVGNIFGK